MSKDKIADYDGTTAGNNTDIGGISIAEGMLPSAVNNSMRELTKQLGAFANGTDAIDALTVTGDLTVDTNTLKVDAANNRVGVNTSSPSQPLSILTSNGLLNIANGNTSNGTKIQSFVTAGNANGYLAFEGFDKEYARLDADGLKFNGDTAAANALDDYETGSFTPTAEGNTTAGTGTYLYQVGSYVKVGSLVQFQLNMQWSSHSGSGVVLIKGLPFTSKNTTNLFSVGSMYASGLPIASNHRAMPFMVANRTYFNVNQENGSGGASSVNIDSAAQILLTGVYRTDA